MAERQADPGAVLGAAVEAHREGRPEAAIPLYHAALDLFTDAPARHTIGLWLAAALCDADRRGEAVVACEAAIVKCPELADGHALLAGICLELGELDRAEAAAAAAIAREPDRLGTLNLATGIALASGRAEVAAARAADCLRLAPANQRALSHRLVALAQRGPDAEVAYLLDFDRLLRVMTVAPPAGFASIEDFNAALSAGIRSSTRLDRRHIGKTMVGGARLHDCFTLEPVLAEALRGIFRDQARAYDQTLAVDAAHPVRRGRPAELVPMVSWANIMERSDYELPHIHDASWLSGVYYVEMPDGEAGDAGAIQFGGHDFGTALAETGPTRTIRPVPGRMVLFPAYFYHRTIPFAASGRRISIAFDVRLAAPG